MIMATVTVLGTEYLLTCKWSQLTLYGSGFSLLLRLYVTVPGGRERMCENEPNYLLVSGI